MTKILDQPSAGASGYLRKYGTFCIGANLLLGLQGLHLRNPGIAVAGFGSAAAQLVNIVKRDPAKPFTTTALMAGAAVFGLEGAHSHHNAHAVFGSLKFLGLPMLHYGEELAGLLIQRLPSLRLLNRMPSINPKIVGESILFLAALALIGDGAKKTAEFFVSQEGTALMDAGVTTAVAAGLIYGQRCAGRAHAANAVATMLPRTAELPPSRCIPTDG